MRQKDWSAFITSCGPVSDHPSLRSARRVTEPKSDSADIARIALDGIEAGETEIVADEISKQALAGLAAGVRGLYPQVA
jgi:hypothetical protein